MVKNFDVLDFIRDKSGKFSSMRILAFIVVCTVMFTWSKLCIAEGNLIPLDWQQVAAVVGVLMAKAGQAGTENKGE